jgi:hypothetical protein
MIFGKDNMVKRSGPPSQGWGTVLRNHAPDIAAMDLLIVPAIGFDLLHALVIIVTRRLRAMGIECVDHIVVLSEAHLRRILQAYAGYYNKSERIGH